MNPTIYSIVYGDQVVAGPFIDKETALAHCGPDEKVIEVLPSDQGYDDFLSYLGEDKREGTDE